jgi:hypothetical protein
MIHDFIRRHDLDIVFLQEITDPAILNVTGYATYLNIGADMRGTAIITRQDFPSPASPHYRLGELSPQITADIVLYKYVCTSRYSQTRGL